MRNCQSEGDANKRPAGDGEDQSRRPKSAPELSGARLDGDHGGQPQELLSRGKRGGSASDRESRKESDTASPPWDRLVEKVCFMMTTETRKRVEQHWDMQALMNDPKPPEATQTAQPK